MLELSSVTSMDSSAVHALKDIMAEYAERRISLVFSNPNSDVLTTMKHAGLLLGAPNATPLGSIGQQLFVSTADAVRACVIAMREEVRAHRKCTCR